MIHIVLFEPEIPGNTGNIIRTSMAFNCKLHLIEPLGFSLDEKHLRRSGMDYIKDADIEIHPNWEDFDMKNPSKYKYFMTRYGKRHLLNLTLPPLTKMKRFIWSLEKKAQELISRF